MTKKFWMVLGNGTPTFRHDSKYKAQNEAERLVSLNPTCVFTVLEAVAEVKASRFQWNALEEQIPTTMDDTVPF